MMSAVGLLKYYVDALLLIVHGLHVLRAADNDSKQLDHTMTLLKAMPQPPTCLRVINYILRYNIKITKKRHFTLIH
jgi:predicted transporter